jgi:formylglycine-generating enzyme required for sulfatase activity
VSNYPTARWWESDIGWNRANCNGCGSSSWDNRSTSPFSVLYPNPFGLFDMLGNASEMVEDCWHRNYEGAPSDGSAWTSGDHCEERVTRGGNWRANPWLLRSAIRTRTNITDKINLQGFRIAKTVF